MKEKKGFKHITIHIEVIISNHTILAYLTVDYLHSMLCLNLLVVKERNRKSDPANLISTPNLLNTKTHTTPQNMPHAMRQ